MAQTNVQAFSGDVEISGETVLGTATYRKKIRWDRNELAYVYLGNIRTNNTTGIRLDVSLNSSNSGYEMYQFQITLNSNDESHAGGKMIYSTLGGDTGSVNKEVDIGYVYVGDGGAYEYQLWLKDPTTDNTGAMDAYLNCQGYYNFDTGVSDVSQGGAAPTNFNLSIVGVLVDRLGNVGIGTNNPVGVNGGQCIEGSSTTGFEYIATRDDTTGVVDDFVGAYLFKNTDTDGNEPHYAGMSAKVTGTNGPMDLRFHTNRDQYEADAVPAMIINQLGNVGIGKTDPGTALDVLGTIRVQTGTNDAAGGEFSIDTNVGHIRRKVG